MNENKNILTKPEAGTDLAIPLETFVIQQGGRYEIVYADPPWQYKFPGTRKEKTEDYATMKTEDIAKLPIGKLVAPNAVLFMWVIWTKLYDALEVIKRWGFEYKTVGFVWVKVNKNTNTDQFSFLPCDSFDAFWGMGSWTRSNVEVCLIGTKGKPLRRSASVHQVIYSPIQRHSKKPDETRERIVELMGDLPRIELFARQKADGWDVWGNEVENDVSLAV